MGLGPHVGRAGLTLTRPSSSEQLCYRQLQTHARVARSRCCSILLYYSNFGTCRVACLTTTVYHSTCGFIRAALDSLSANPGCFDTFLFSSFLLLVLLLLVLVVAFTKFSMPYDYDYDFYIILFLCIRVATVRTSLAATAIGYPNLIGSQSTAYHIYKKKVLLLVVCFVMTKPDQTRPVDRAAT